MAAYELFNATNREYKSKDRWHPAGYATEFSKDGLENLRLCRPALEAISTWAQMNDNQRGALYSFAYNIGAHFYNGKNFKSITLVCDSPDRWNDNEWIEAQFVKYCSPDSNVEEGLRRRRKAEADLFCTPVS